MTKNQHMLENIYDIIKVSLLSDKQNDDWATLSRKHGEEAKKELKQWGRDKYISWGNDPVNDTGYITIGKHFVIKLEALK